MQGVSRSHIRKTFVYVAALIVVAAILSCSATVNAPQPAARSASQLDRRSSVDRLGDAERRLDLALELLSDQTDQSRIDRREIAIVAGELLLTHPDELDLLQPALVADLVDPAMGALFVDAEGTTEAGWAVLASLDDADSHGIDLDAARTLRLVEMTGRIQQDPEATPGRLSLAQKERSKLVREILRADGALPPRELASRLVQIDGELAHAGLAGEFQQRKNRRERRAVRLARTEVALMDALMRYALAMTGEDPVAAVAPTSRLLELLQQLDRRRQDFDAAQRAIASLQPRSEEYQRLRVAYEALRAQRDSSTWGAQALQTATIKLNLERMRALPIDRNQTYVMVNAASGQGWLVRNGDRILAFELAREGDGEPLPTFSSRIERVSVEPTGVVRFRIAGDQRVELCGSLHGGKGCTRLLRQSLSVDQPQRLADRLLEITGQGHLRTGDLEGSGRTQQVRINPGVPIHVTYLTATTDTGGRLHFHDDVDRRDDDAWLSVAQGPPPPIGS